MGDSAAGTLPRNIHCNAHDVADTETAIWDGLSDEALKRFEQELLNGPSVASGGLPGDAVRRGNGG